MRTFICIASIIASVTVLYSAPENIAAGKPYRLEPVPNYSLCTDPGDVTQLTDGKKVSELFWAQPGCVGWASVSPVVITVDLQTNQPIAGVSFNTASSASAGVGWPSEIYVWVSDDEKTWRVSGDLVALSSKNALPPPVSQNASHRFETMELETRGRFVRFIVVPTESYVFSDEIEVYRGSDSLLKKTLSGSIVTKVPSFKPATKLDSFVRRRTSADVSALRTQLKTSPCDEKTRLNLTKQLDEIARSIPSSRVTNAENFKTIFPLNEPHRKTFAVQSALWRAAGFKGVVAWPARRWDMLSPVEPPKATETKIEVSMMQNEFRSGAFNLSNASERDAKIQITIEGLPSGINPDYITVHEVPFTDTQSGVPVAAALPVIEQKSGKYAIEIPSGMTRQVWLTFNPGKVGAGDFVGKIVVRASGSRNTTIPLRLKVYPITFPDQPTLHLGGWDYTDQEQTYFATPENRNELIRHLREHFVDTPWSQTMVMPEGKYDATGRMTEPPDSKGFRTWVDRWPGARNYFVFNNLGEKFAGFAMGTPEWKRAVTEWINWWAKELPKMNVQPRQLGMLIVDEPREEIHDKIVIAYGEVIRAAQPEVVIFEDPIWNGPWKGAKKMYEVSDILCPNLPLAIEAGPKYLNFYLKYRDAGHRLWFYSCHGPGRLLDPYSYHRLQQWFCWKHRAEGAGFWSFSDSNGASSWNEYLTSVGSYTPFFIDEKSVTPGKQMEAIREGMEDYEYLKMLRDRVESLEKQGTKTASLAAARDLLDTAADRVVGSMNIGQIYWSTPKDREVADQVRLEILESLIALSRVTMDH